MVKCFTWGEFVNDFCFVIAYVIIVSALFFTTLIAKNNIYMNKSYSIYYVYVSYITMLLAVCDLVRFFCYNYYVENKIMLIKICSFIILICTPLVPYYLCYFANRNGDNCKSKAIFKIPLLINIIINLLGLRFDLIYKSSEELLFSKGPLYIIEFIITVFYIVVLEIEIIDSGKFNKKKIEYNIFIFLLWIFGIVVQLINYKMTISWLCIAISIILYYIIFSEKNFMFDALTETKNRNAFENDMAMLSHKVSKAVIVVFDLNELKLINDTKGHDYGDKHICQAAHTIKATFYGVGDTYRIGGDEFCVICPYKSLKSVQSLLNKMEQKIIRYNKRMNSEMSIAYGCATYYKMRYSKITPLDVFKQADKNMYERKSTMKKEKETQVRL